MDTNEWMQQRKLLKMGFTEYATQFLLDYPFPCIISFLNKGIRDDSELESGIAELYFLLQPSEEDVCIALHLLGGVKSPLFFQQLSEALIIHINVFRDMSHPYTMAVRDGVIDGQNYPCVDEYLVHENVYPSLKNPPTGILRQAIEKKAIPVIEYIFEKDNEACREVILDSADSTVLFRFFETQRLTKNWSTYAHLRNTHRLDPDRVFAMIQNFAMEENFQGTLGVFMKFPYTKSSNEDPVLDLLVSHNLLDFEILHDIIMFGLLVQDTAYLQFGATHIAKYAPTHLKQIRRLNDDFPCYILSNFLIEAGIPVTAYQASTPPGTGIILKLREFFDTLNILHSTTLPSGKTYSDLFRSCLIRPPGEVYDSFDVEYLETHLVAENTHLFYMMEGPKSTESKTIKAFLILKEHKTFNEIIAVCADYRESLGKALLLYAEYYTIRDGKRVIILSPVVNKVSFYMSLGFVPIKDMKDDEEKYRRIEKFCSFPVENHLDKFEIDTFSPATMVKCLDNVDFLLSINEIRRKFD
jgi:hypothetical protein